jgi:Ca2+ transporting ATPase
MDPCPRNPSAMAMPVTLVEAAADSAEEVSAHYGVDPTVGLSADEVVANRQRYGRNELAPEPGTPLWKLVLKQFDDLLVRILLLAAVVDFLIALTDGDSVLGALVEPSVIVAILVANATVGVVTERNAESAIEELKTYEAESAAVLRGGTRLLVATSDLVPGDVVELAVGTKVPADIRLVSIAGSVLDVDQSLLTGESQSAEKSVAATATEEAVYQDMDAILFSGTLVVAGSARGVVVATGGATAIGKIRDALIDTPEEMTPLKIKLDEFGNLLAKVIAAICVLVWLVNIRHFTDPELGGWVSGAIHYFKIAVALAVGGDVYECVCVCMRVCLHMQRLRSDALAL